MLQWRDTQGKLGDSQKTWGGLPDNKTIKIPHSEAMQLLLLQEKTQINITVKNHLIL